MLNLELEEITVWLVPGILCVKLKRRMRTTESGRTRVLK
jgi:hypothetical protein